MINILNFEHVKYKIVNGIRSILELPTVLNQNQSIEIFWDSTYYISSIELSTDRQEILKIENYIGPEHWVEVTESLFTYEGGSLLKITTDMISQGIRLTKTQTGTLSLSQIVVYANPEMAQFEDEEGNILTEIVFNEQSGDEINVRIKNNTDKTLYDLEAYFPENDVAAWAFMIPGEKKLIKPSQTRTERAVLDVGPLLEQLVYNQSVRLPFQTSITTPFVYGPVNTATSEVGIITDKKPNQIEIISAEGVFPADVGTNKLSDVISDFYIVTDIFVNKLFVAVPGIRAVKTYGTWNGEYLLGTEKKPAMMIYRKQSGVTYTPRIV